MKPGTNILLAILGVLLAISVVASLVAYRIENTVFAYSYLSREIEAMAARLEDPAIRERSARDTIDYVRTAFAIKVPVKLSQYVYPAAYAGFDREWYERTGKRLLFNTLLVASGESAVLSLPVSIHEFKLALLDIARIEFGMTEYVEIDLKVSGMPSGFDLAGKLPEDDLDHILRTLQAARPVLLVATYLIPGVLILLCFVPLRIGSALRTTGAGLLAGSAAVLFGALGLRGLATREAAAIIGSLPPFFRWTGFGIEEFIGRLICGMLPALVLVAVSGLLLFSVGMRLIAYRGVRRVNFHKLRRSD